MVSNARSMSSVARQDQSDAEIPQHSNYLQSALVCLCDAEMKPAYAQSTSWHSTHLFVHAPELSMNSCYNMTSPPPPIFQVRLLQ